MKKTRLNSVVFVAICSILLVAAFGGILIYGISIYKYTHQIGILVIAAIAAIILLISGSALVYHAHEDLFDDIISHCEDCGGSFNKDQIEKQIEYTSYGKMYVEHKCPHCRTSLI